jgi:hypothetical protein
MDESTIASGSVVFAARGVDEKAASDDLQREAGCGGHLDSGDDDGGSLARSLLVSCRTQRRTVTQWATTTQEQWDGATSPPTTLQQQVRATESVAVRGWLFCLLPVSTTGDLMKLWSGWEECRRQQTRSKRRRVTTWHRNKRTVQGKHEGSAEDSVDFCDCFVRKNMRCARKQASKENRREKHAHGGTWHTHSGRGIGIESIEISTHRPHFNFKGSEVGSTSKGVMASAQWIAESARRLEVAATRIIKHCSGWLPW